jgi:hypothetical protein
MVTAWLERFGLFLLCDEIRCEEKIQYLDQGHSSGREGRECTIFVCIICDRIDSKNKTSILTMLKLAECFLNVMIYRHVASLPMRDQRSLSGIEHVPYICAQLEVRASGISQSTLS